MPFHDGVSWNSVISGYSSVGRFADALKVYKLMLMGGPWQHMIMHNSMLLGGNSEVYPGRRMQSRTAGLSRQSSEAFIGVGYINHSVRLPSK
ncbi:Pentatricopeptide repeat [Dillenia turbinata]|uniref:Pentatricopeptide repeat n=1 Tax=Dillenia turbinata TaxID=194707 RepID=A0AAN8VDD2_9MAGN